MSSRNLLILLTITILGLQGCKKKTESNQLVNDQTTPQLENSVENLMEYQTISLLGDTLRSGGEPSADLISRFEGREKAYSENPTDLENIIWHGRFLAYTGDYRAAIAIYTEGLETYPLESRLLRHRGHRYITLRELDRAIADLYKASELIQGKENMVEQDGMPNAQGIPVSTMHGNIFYHLGLAYYLDGQFEKAVETYKKCLNTSPNPDNVVSATHWIYMGLMRQGKTEEAEAALEIINTDMKIIENQSYYDLCLFYKGEKELREIYADGQEANPSNSAVRYGIGNWYLYNGMEEEAEKIFQSMVDAPDWASFGHIAAEADLARMNFILEADNRM